MNRCTFEKCPESAIARGLCTRHYMQDRRGRLGKSRRKSADGTSTAINVSIDRDVKAALFLVSRTFNVSASEFARRLIESHAAIADRTRQIRAKRSTRAR